MKNVKINNIKDFVRNNKILYPLLKIIILPFKLIYKFFEFIIQFSNIILNVLLISIFITSIIALFVFAKIRPMLQEAEMAAYEKLSNLNESDFQLLSNTIIYDKDGKKIGEIDSSTYRYASINDISKYVQYGYISTEDKRFLEHVGIDLQSITRAGLALIKNDGEITQGGSTITQQVIKNNLLTQEKSFSRKLIEILLAPRIETKYSKSEIMEFYCNSNYYGNQCYGIEAASNYYFGCSSKKLTLAQAAMLCGVSNSPNNYNPIASIELANKKKKSVLKNMLKYKYITQEEYDAALNEEIKVVGIDNTSTSENYMSSYAIYCTALELMKEDGFQFKCVFKDKKEEEAYEELYSTTYNQKASEIRAGGFKIYTSFDQKIQKQLQETVSNQLSAFKEKDKETKKYTLQGAAVCIDNNTQYVVAIVGGRSKKDQFNRAFLSKRQPGSTIKPLLDYGPAIDNGIINGSSIYNDTKTYWNPNDTSSYSPDNAGKNFRGNVSIREALSRSLNTIAFQLFKEVTQETALSYLDKMHFSSLSYVDSTSPAISIGGFTYGTKISDMCRGYATIANDGQYSDRTCLIKVVHEAKGTIYEEVELKDTETEVYTADTAFILKDMLQGPINDSYGTAHSINNKDQIYAGKTGTTNNNKDTWFCGFSEYYTTSVWVGYDIPKSLDSISGTSYSTRIWSEFMNSLHENLEKKDFEIPSTIQLRQVSNGEFTDTKKEIKYSKKKSIYNQRPNGYDYYSEQNELKLTEWQHSVELNNAIKIAEEAVSKFEKYKIESAEDALNFETNYYEVISIIEQIPDEYEQTPYKQRAANKYNTLNNEALTAWKKAIEEYEKDKAEELVEQESIDAEDAYQNANDYLKENRITKVKWYIEKLNERRYYTDITKLLITDSKKALKRTKGYTEYNTLKTLLDNAIKRAEALPEEIEIPVIPQDSEDESEINEDRYEEETTTEEETTVITETESITNNETTVYNIDPTTFFNFQ